MGPGGSGIKPFSLSFSLMMYSNRLECFFLISLFQTGPDSSSCLAWVGSGLTRKFYTRLKKSAS